MIRNGNPNVRDYQNTFYVLSYACLVSWLDDNLIRRMSLVGFALTKQLDVNKQYRKNIF